MLTKRTARLVVACAGSLVAGYLLSEATHARVWFFLSVRGLPTLGCPITPGVSFGRWHWSDTPSGFLDY